MEHKEKLKPPDIKNWRPQSFSSLNKYAGCNYSYYLRYVAKVQPDIDRDLTGTVPGLVCHSLAEKFFEKREKENVIDYEIFEKGFEELFKSYIYSPFTKLGPDAFAANIEEARTTIKSWRDNLIALIQENYVTTGVTISEVRFGNHHSPLKISDSFYMTGGTDLYQSVDKNTPGRLIDFKASDSTFHLNFKQLYLGALGFKKKFDIETSMVGFFLFKAKRVEWKSCNQERLEDAQRWAEGIIDLISKDSFKENPSKSTCSMCEHRVSCKYSSFQKKSNNIFDAYKTKSTDFKWQSPKL